MEDSRSSRYAWSYRLVLVSWVILFFFLLAEIGFWPSTIFLQRTRRVTRVASLPLEKKFSAVMLLCAFFTSRVRTMRSRLSPFSCVYSYLLNDMLFCNKLPQSIVIRFFEIWNHIPDVISQRRKHGTSSTGVRCCCRAIFNRISPWCSSASRCARVDDRCAGERSP